MGVKRTNGKIEVPVFLSTYHADATGAVEVKGKGPVEMYFLNRIRPELPEDGEGRRPNASFNDKARI
ncbi:MAG: hypothetical protein IIA01_00425 [Proteobacteria bacterium]|nr:hypothetical protein [Pseudomonadota bacterium]